MRMHSFRRRNGRNAAGCTSRWIAGLRHDEAELELRAPSKRHILIISATQAAANERLAHIRHELETNWLIHKVFPEIAAALPGNRRQAAATGGKGRRQAAAATGDEDAD